jgi:hypothetical protein
MYPEKKLRKAPLDTPLLFTFRRHVQRGPFKGLYHDRIVAIVEIIVHISIALKVIAIETNSVLPPPPGYISSGTSFWFLQIPNTKGYAILNPLYLQTIEEFLERDLPLLLGWPHQYPGLATLLCGGSNGLPKNGIQEG